MLPDKFGALVAGVVFGEPQFVILSRCAKTKNDRMPAAVRAVHEVGVVHPTPLSRDCTSATFRFEQTELKFMK